MTAWLDAPDHDQTVSTLASTFAERFGLEPAGVWSAPGRVNVIGEHTDYNQGFCLPMALPHRTYAAAVIREGGRLRLASVQQDQAWEGTVADIGPGAPSGWAAYAAGVVWALAQRGVEVPGLDLLVDGHVPLGSGLSSSAALECAVATAVRDLSGTDLDVVSMAAACIDAENVVAGANTGGMDQTISLRAVAGHALLLDCRSMVPTQVPWGLGADGWELMVIDTRAPHQLVDGQYAERRSTTEAAARTLGVPALRDISLDHLDEALGRLDPLSQRRVRHVVTDTARAVEAADVITAGDVAALGALMVASHASARDDYQISCPELDLAVDTALDNGSPGARMTGGGFGGSAIALVREGAEAALADAIAAAFTDRGFGAPQFLVATPQGSARRDR